jgi:DNA primase catalytic core
MQTGPTLFSGEPYPGGRPLGARLIACPGSGAGGRGGREMTDQKPDIIQVAQVLNCLPDKRSGGRHWGGNCPAKHESKEGRCFNIWEATQSFHCFHCGAGGDVFELIKTSLGCDFKEAIYWATEKGLITGNGHNEGSYTERRKIHQILTDAAKFFHANLKDYSHPTEHYGFTEETIRQHLIGYAPIDKNALKKHLIDQGHKLEDIKKTGLLGKFDDSFFQGQFIFPYWNQGLVKYFIGRQTTETPDWKTAKYEKLPTTDIIKNEIFYGEDSIRGKDTVYVTEGVTDCLAALQHGLPSISPVTVQPKKADRPKLLQLLKGKRVYLIPDNEENQAGMKGAKETLSFLRNNDIEACIITLPKPAGQEKIDLNEFLRDHGIDAFNRLVEEQTPRRVIPASILLRKEYPREQEIIGKGILPKGGGLILAGESGEGKSLMRLELAIHLAMGWPLWDMEITTARRVLIFQFENTEAQEAYRLKRMLRGLEITTFPDNLSFSDPTIRVDMGRPQDRAKMTEIVQESGAEVVIYDPLTSLHRVNENDNVQIRIILDNLTEINRRTGTTAMLIHHFGKPNENTTTAHRTRGASSIKDWADTLVAVTRKKHEHRILRLVEFIKVRNGPERKPMLIERDENFLHHITEEDMLCPPEKVREILTGLGGHIEGQEPLKQAIIEAVGCSPRSAATFISLAVERGTIRAEPNPVDSRKKIYGSR